MPSAPHGTPQYANNHAEHSPQLTRQRERQTRRFSSAGQHHALRQSTASSRISSRSAATCCQPTTTGCFARECSPIRMWLPMPAEPTEAATQRSEVRISVVSRTISVRTLRPVAAIWRRMVRWSLPLRLGLAAVSVLGGVSAIAQTPVPCSHSSETCWLQLSVEQRGRWEQLHDSFRPETDGPSRTLALRSRVRAQVGRPHTPLRLTVELQDARGLFTDAPFIDPTDHVDELDILQAIIQLRDDRWGGSTLFTELGAGRFTLDLGRRRLSARNRMRNTTNAFDGLQWRVGRDQLWTLDTFLSQPVVIRPSAFDSSRNGGRFWGAVYTGSLLGRTDAEGYYLGLSDEVGIVTARRYTTFGGRLSIRPKVSRFDGEVEVVRQRGRTQGLTHRAHYQHLELGYTTHHRSQPRVSLHYDHASGDEDPTDNRWGQFDTLFGARRFELNPTGIYGPFVRSNLRSPGLRVATTPHDNLQLTGFYRVFWLAARRDAWVESGWHDPTGRAGHSLGRQIEVSAVWRLLPALTLETGYAHLRTGSYVERVTGGTRSPNPHFFYVLWEVAGHLVN